MNIEPSKVFDKDVLVEWIHKRIKEETNKVSDVIKDQGNCGLNYIAGEETAYRDVLEKIGGIEIAYRDVEENYQTRMSLNVRNT